MRTPTLLILVRTARTSHLFDPSPYRHPEPPLPAGRALALACVGSQRIGGLGPLYRFTGTLTVVGPELLESVFAWLTVTNYTTLLLTGH